MIRRGIAQHPVLSVLALGVLGGLAWGTSTHRDINEACMRWAVEAAQARAVVADRPYAPPLQAERDGCTRIRHGFW